MRQLYYNLQVPLQNNVKPPMQYSGQNKVYLFLLHGFKNLNDTFFIVSAVNTLKHLAVFPSTHLPHDFIIILVPVKRTPYHLQNEKETYSNARFLFQNEDWYPIPRLESFKMKWKSFVHLNEVVREVPIGSAINKAGNKLHNTKRSSKKDTRCSKYKPSEAHLLP